MMVFDLPAWCADIDVETARTDPTDQIRLAVELAERNVATGSGGPFGAAIFEIESGRLVSCGVNMVVPSKSPIAHAEIVAITRACEATETFDLGAPGVPAMALATSTEPCAMCFGAVPWSGVRRLITSARDAEAREIGFDEGPKMADWKQALERRGIEVITDVERQLGADVLREYAARGGLLYNGRGGH